MMDETTDISDQEETTIVLCHVIDMIKVLQDLLGMYQVQAFILKHLQKLQRMPFVCNLPLSNLSGQCYDGASALYGARAGVTASILAKKHHSLYTHCYGYSINLAACDALSHKSDERGNGSCS